MCLDLKCYVFCLLKKFETKTSLSILKNGDKNKRHFFLQCQYQILRVISASDQQRENVTIDISNESNQFVHCNSTLFEI